MYNPNKKRRIDAGYQGSFSTPPLDSYFSAGFLSVLASEWQKPAAELNAAEILGPLYQAPFYPAATSSVQQPLITGGALDYSPSTPFSEASAAASLPEPAFILNGGINVFDNEEYDIAIADEIKNATTKANHNWLNRVWRANSIAERALKNISQINQEKHTQSLRVEGENDGTLHAIKELPKLPRAQLMGKGQGYADAYEQAYSLAQAAKNQNFMQIDSDEARKAGIHYAVKKIPPLPRAMLMQKGQEYADAYQAGYDQVQAQRGKKRARADRLKNSTPVNYEVLLQEQGKAYADAYAGYLGIRPISEKPPLLAKRTLQEIDPLSKNLQGSAPGRSDSTTSDFVKQSPQPDFRPGSVSPYSFFVRLPAQFESSLISLDDDAAGLNSNI
ncbi:hypothetical protein [Legionella septentrionalis]|uniref:Uncharacterized protein n=2 Tax=Legionellaceae TaxID=444 RepID=A0A433JL64_9GAMM|nr:hypothetical protein [Legionella septentrionalis]RUQ89718.1 hypothetical protein EKM59_02870 [Legionella septentrionalis]